MPHYEVKEGETLTVPGPANVRIWGSNYPSLDGSATSPGGNPTIASLDPNTAQMGAADLTMTVNGTGFTPTSIIVFNGGDEPTTYISATQVSTGIKPSLVGAAVAVPVEVRNDTKTSNAVNFTFTPAAARRR